jgi:glycosyltransferase involved in cell wall biosynthesis
MSASFAPISVILPFYKGDVPAYFDLALKSLFDQTLRADELVLIQDGPVSEEHLEVVHRWKSLMPEIVLLQRPINGGLSQALNSGIHKAKNEWLARMDADDICVEDRFEKQWQLIQKRPELDILGSWIVEYDESMTKVLGERRLPETHKELLAYAKWRCPFNHMTVMYRKSALEKLGHYKDYGAVGDDYELWGRFLMKGFVGHTIQESLVHARTGSDFFVKRRRGLRYLKNELNEIRDLRNMGLLSQGHFAVHFLIKSIVRLAPVWLVKLVYSTLRRSA